MSDNFETCTASVMSASAKSDENDLEDDDNEEVDSDRVERRTLDAQPTSVPNEKQETAGSAVAVNTNYDAQLLPMPQISDEMLLNISKHSSKMHDLNVSKHKMSKASILVEKSRHARFGDDFITIMNNHESLDDDDMDDIEEFVTRPKIGDEEKVQLIGVDPNSSSHSRPQSDLNSSSHSRSRSGVRRAGSILRHVDRESSAGSVVSATTSDAGSTARFQGNHRSRANRRRGHALNPLRRNRNNTSNLHRGSARRMPSNHSLNGTRQASMRGGNSIRGGINRSESIRAGHQHMKGADDRIRLLALHGKQANKAVTKLQLQNLEITPEKYDIVYLKGPILEENGDPHVIGLVSGPFYSWFYNDSHDPRFKSSLINGIVYLLKAIHDKGPFDAIYGFSQGATIATIAAAGYLDASIRRAIMTEYNDIRCGDHGNHDGSWVDTHNHDRRNLLYSAPSARGTTSFRNVMQSFRNIASNSSLGDAFFDEEPFSYMILACSVGISEDIMEALGLSKSYLEPSSINIPSMHLIGIDDPCRVRGEDMLSLFCDAQMRYMVGGHGVGRLIGSDKETLNMLHEGIDHLDNAVSMRFSEMSKTSSISKLAPMFNWQVAAVELDELMEYPTITRMLESKDPNKPLLYNARGTDSTNFLSYGDVLSFIQGGRGDLRRLGVKDGEVVAYGAPGNGGAVAALAFLSISSQTTAAPIAPSATEDDALYLLQKYDAKHLILFEGVECPGLEAIYTNMLSNGKMKVHKARMLVNEKPGIFDFFQTEAQTIDPRWVPSSESLSNPSDGIGLLLSTSGTTSKPKGVPILHGSLVHNGQIIGSTLGLNHSDICYSTMPLFHIGGIAASIMCTMATGGAVCCDGEGYNPERMIDALAISNPQPTWYSAVPTIHNSTVSFLKTMAEESETLQNYGISKDGIWKEGHSLRFIRSGAAALLAPDASALTAAYGDIPIIPTYSMSEQMPISQPPVGKNDMIVDKPGSVGMPVAASVAIVNPTTLKVMPYGKEGEIAICGPTVIRSYLNNKEADAKAYFALTLPVQPNSPFKYGRYFLTGDLGVLDKEGYLTLRGRNKEMIKKGGEQITPMEVEEPLLDHPWVKIVVCFSVPSRIYGEEVGCAIVLSPDASEDTDSKIITKELKAFLRIRALPPLKWPTKWKILKDETDLPKTKSNKFIRVGLAKFLGMDGEPENDEILACENVQVVKNSFIDWDVLSGFRFSLSCYVMFMHIGSNKSWGVMSNLRGWPWHVHVFFTLGGYSMAAPMNPAIKKKFKYFLARMGSMYPMYAIALIFAIINLIVTCRPSTFRSDFSWHSKPDDLYIDGDESKGISPLFCEGTPLTPKSYWASLALTLTIYLIGVPISPVWVLNWWMGYYFWFSAMYYQCLLVFPSLYNYMLKKRGETRRYFRMLVFLLILNCIFLVLTWILVKDVKSYNIYNAKTGKKNESAEYNEKAFLDNAIVLGWYLFSPFWMLYFAIGACAAFLYDAYRPTEQSNRHIWGLVADICTSLILLYSIVIVSQGNVGYNFGKTFFLRPDEANNYTDPSSVNRIWDNICGRLFAPLTTLWIFSLSTGKGLTASFLRTPFLIETIAPHSYNCFLFHQMVGQWYYAATRNGHWWNWWRYRKSMYWFSPAPCPVEWYEYFYVVGLTVSFSALMNATAQPIMNAAMAWLKRIIFGESDPKVSVEEALLDAVEDMTGFEPELDWTLDQCGLSSVGLPILAARLKKAFSTKTSPLNITTAALSQARTVQDLVIVIQEIQALSSAGGV